MKRSIWLRLMAVILVISMLAAPVSAAPNRGNDGVRTNGAFGIIVDFIRDIIRDIFDDWFDEPGEEEPTPTTPVNPTTPTPTQPGETEPEETDPTEPIETTAPTEPTVPTEPSVPSEPTVPSEPEEKPETVLTLVEDYSNTENGHLLRGHTYSLSQVIAQQSEPQVAPYALRSNAVSTLADEGTTGGGNSEIIETEKEVFTNWVDGGQYYIQSAATVKAGGAGWVKVNMTNGVPASLTQGEQSEATAWTVTFNKDGTYSLSLSVDGTTYYLSVSTNGISFSTTAVSLQIENFSPSANAQRVDDDGNLMRIGSNGRYLNRTSDTTFTAHDNAGGANNSLWLYQVKDGTTKKVTVETVNENIKVVYFPVTMFNYDTDAINNATHAAEYLSDSDTWNGIYFSDGSPNSNDYVVTVPGEPIVTTEYEVTYELVTPTISNRHITNLDANADYILVNKRSGRAVTVGTSGSIDGSNMKLVDSADLGLGQNPASAPESFKVTYEAADSDNASIWKYYSSNGSRYFRTTSDAYMTFTDDSSGTNTSGTALSFGTVSGDSNAFTIYYTTRSGWNNTIYHYLSDHGGGNRDYYRGWTSANDDGNPFYIYERVSVEPVTVTVPNDTTTTYTKNGYAGHNYFNKGGGKADGDLVWTGLAADHLDENENIVFNYPDGGIFSYDRDALDENCFDGVKNVYEFVGMPFVLSENGVYTFDSDQNGVYFEDTDGDLDNDPTPGTSERYNNLKFDYGIPQPLHMADMDGQGGVADKSRNGWFPYNLWATRTVDGVTKTGYGMIDPELYDNKNMDYHFGMRADLRFSMTANGRVKSTDDTSEEIIFRFSGDDDVWIYIDGQQVVDLGGMHNRLDIEIDFAKNTVTYSEHTSADTNNDTGSYNDPENWSAVQKLFTDAEGEGLIATTRENYATNESHTLQFFYLERGEGTSNCRIEFNLPMRDTIEITKDATKSWSAAQDVKDGASGDGTLPLTEKEQEAVDKLLFGFTLYKMEGSYFNEDGTTVTNPKFTPVSGTNFYVLDKSGNVVDIPSTDANGRFYLKNGQTAKFMTEIPGTGVTYYLVEDDLPSAAFLTPDYKYGGTTTYGFDYTGSRMKPGTNEVETVPMTHVSNAEDLGEHELPLDAEENKSYIITAKGSVESIDSLKFTCINYLEHNDQPVVAHATEDIIVIDYGLPVKIDPIANDIIRGENVESVEIVDVKIGDHDFQINEDGTIEDMLPELTNNSTFAGHSGTFTLNRADENNPRDTFDYVLNKQLTEVEVLTYLIKATAPSSEYSGDSISTYSQAKLYVVPATIMYYEEDFTDLVKFTNKDGEMTPEVMKKEQYISEYQEPGVVGTIDDSTYGSDVAYLEDSEDSNGTSYFFDTTNGYVRFQYTFTGTGTSFFARTSATTGYMQVLLFPGDVKIEAGNQIDTYYRDTYFFKGEDDYSKTSDDDPLYNIPVYTNDDLPYGTYTVLVTVAKKGTKAAGPMNPEKNNMKYSMHEFYLDGIRVMQPLNGVFETNAETSENEAIPNERLDPITQKALGAYATDGESNLEIATLRRKILEEFTPDYDADNGEEEPNWPFAVLTDINKQIVKASQYESSGPKEEVYLSGVDNTLEISNAQTVSFSLKYWHPEGLKLYMGMKAPFGSATVKVGNQPKELKNATDCYYDVTDDYASQITVYDQLCDANGRPLYTDPSGNQVYEKEDGTCYYVQDHTPVPQDIELNPIDDLSKPLYYVVTYTFEAVDNIVSLTNIKVVGSYEFTILENTDMNTPGNE